MYTQKNLRPITAKNYAFFAGKFVRSNRSPEEFASSYANASSHDNAVNALKHYHDFMGLARPKLRYLKTSPERLITAPKKEEVLRVLKQVEPPDVKAYMALCSTVGLRPQRLLKACWHEIDFENGIVNISENVRSKIYRPNPLHEDVSKLLRQLQTTTRPNGRVFNFDAHKIRNSLKAIRTSLRPHDMRDFFYNHARRSGVDKDLVEWCMGHSIGIRAHYLGDNVKEEYAKFEEKFRLL